VLHLKLELKRLNKIPRRVFNRRKSGELRTLNRMRCETTPNQPHRPSSDRKKDAPDSTDQGPASAPLTSASAAAIETPTAPSWCSKECSLLVLWRNSGMDVRTADGSTRTPSSRPAVRTEEESVSGRSHMDFHRLDHTVRHLLQRNESHDGSHGDRHAGAAVETDSIDLMIEANQDSFFQVWGERPIRYNFTSFTSCFLP
jgi:hypothetical protein